MDNRNHPTIPKPDYNNSDSDSSRPSSPVRDYPENLNDSPKNTLDVNYQISRPSIGGRVSPVPRKTKDAGSRTVQNNAAYQLHLKNHLKYATVKNVANYNDCPICQQFGKGDVANGEGDVYSPPSQQRSPAAALSEENQVFNGIPVFLKKSPRSRHRAPPIYQRRPSTDSADDQQMEYFKEMAEPDAIYFRVIKSRRALAAQELSVVKNEFVRVIDGEGNWWACENKYGYAGYVPKNILQQATQDIFQEPSNPRMPYNMVTDIPSKAGRRQSAQNH
jgi:hypothetical protein